MTGVAKKLNQIYEFVPSIEVDSAIASSPEIKRFSSALRIIRKFANANQDDVNLGELGRIAGGFRYRLLSAPLPLSHPALIDDQNRIALLRNTRLVGMSYRELSEPTEELRVAFQLIRSSEANPLFAAIEASLSASSRRIGFAIRATQLAQAVQEVGNVTQRGIRVVSESQLRQIDVFDQLYLFGAMRWYSAHVFSAPRTAKLTVVRYDVVRDGPPEESKFIHQLSIGASSAADVYTKAATYDPGSDLDADEIIPTLDIEALVRHFESIIEKGERDDQDDLVDAKLLLLEQGFAVLVPLTDSSKELVIDLGEEAREPVHRVKTSELEPGMAVLMRTEGGGDYVAPAANQIMGARANDLRRVQLAWKQKIREQVFNFGTAAVIRRLKQAGSLIASDQNLRNWMSPRSIRTMNRADFDAIFSVIGSAAEANEIWGLMGVILRTHQQAGALIRKRLLEIVRSADLSGLQRDGRMNFSLPGELGGGGITAVRISKVTSRIVRVPWSEVHRLIAMGV